jgi:hypothetical protein
MSFYEHGNEQFVSSEAGNFLARCITISFARKTLHNEVNFTPNIELQVVTGSLISERLQRKYVC